LSPVSTDSGSSKELVGDVAGDLGDGDVGGRPLGEVRERSVLEPALDRREVVERGAEVDEQQVGLVPENGEQPGVALVGVGDQLPVFQEGLALLDRPFPLSLGGVATRPSR